MIKIKDGKEFIPFNENVKLISIMVCVLVLPTEEQEQLKHSMNPTLTNLGNKHVLKKDSGEIWRLRIFFLFNMSYYIGNSRMRNTILTARLITLIRPVLFKNKSKTDARTGPGDKYLSSP